MALIFCSECGHQVSDKASACPNCGAPISVSAPVPPVPPATPVHPATEENNGGGSLVVLGYVFSGLSLLIFPFIFGVTGLVFGIINAAKGNAGHGVVQILISVVSIIWAFAMFA